jgi:hypothetical protein
VIAMSSDWKNACARVPTAAELLEKIKSVRETSEQLSYVLHLLQPGDHWLAVQIGFELIESNVARVKARAEAGEPIDIHDRIAVDDWRCFCLSSLRILVDAHPGVSDLLS